MAGTVAALLTPWIGPHLDRYLPIGMVLLQAHGEATDAGFWAIAGIMLGIAYPAWFTLLAEMATWLGRRHRRKH